MKKILCWFKKHKRGETKYLGNKNWHIECQRCGYTIEYLSPMARLVSTEMGLFEYLYCKWRELEHRRLGCAMMINDGKGPISYHEWHRRFADSCWCGVVFKKKKRGSRVKY